MPHESPQPAARRLWSCALLDALLLVVALLVVFSPPWHVYSAYAQLPEYPLTVETRRGEVQLALARAPFSPVTEPYHEIVETRLLVPLLAHTLHLPPAAILAGPYVLAVVAVAQMLVFARRRGVSRLVSLGVALLLTVAGWFISSTGWLGYYDSALVVGLLAVSHGRPRWALIVACLLTPWVDERFILALPLAFATRWLGGVDNFFSDEPATRRNFRADAITVATLTALYLALRFSIPHYGHGIRLDAYLAEQETLKIGLGRHLLGLWEGLRFGWIGVAAGLVLLNPPSAPWRCVLWAGMLATALTSQLIANDISRSMVVLLPFAFEGAVQASLRLRTRARWALLPLGAAACAIPAQIVVTDFSLEVFTLPKVLALRADLRLDRSASDWLVDARASFNQGNVASAEFKARIAARLDPKLTHAHNMLGIIAAGHDRWQEASGHFARACQLEPQNAALWINLASAFRRVSDYERCRQCLAMARQVAGNNAASLAGIAELEAALARESP